MESTPIPVAKRLLAKRLLVKEAACAEVRVQLLIVGLVKGLRLNSEISEDVFGNFTVIRGTLDGLRASITQQQPAPDAKLITPGVAAKVVVIIEN